MRRLSVLTVGTVAMGLALVGWAGPASACGGLVAPNGTVRLLRTSTLAAYHDGIEHYVTSFQFAGSGTAGEFGSIVPLPGVPTKVERGGDWTLQRLERETTPPPKVFDGGFASTAAALPPAQVILQTRIDALDLTVLSGGGAAVGDWAKAHGFLLTPDAPAVLDFYAARSPIFLAARFDAAAARAKGQLVGDGTPIHLTIPTPNPWVPLRILALGRGALEPVQADVYLLNDRQPALLPAPAADSDMQLAVSEPASASLLRDLRSDKGMGWVPDQAWLTLLRIDGQARQLTHDLAIDASGAGRPSVVQAGLTIDQATATAVPGFQPLAAPTLSGRRRTYGLLVGGLVFGLALATVVALAFRRRPVT
jgi:Uncharacterized protein conserved in bacteria (DUF2330)